MPFTPYHFGPSACIALPLRKYIDIPIFILANVVVDLEPLAVILLGLNYPLHGLFHTFLIGTILGLVWGLAAYPARNFFKRLMRLFGLPYKTSIGRMIVSGLLGVWFHILLDSLCWRDIRPFWPLNANPFANLMTVKTIYLLCTISFLPAAILYILAVIAFLKNKAQTKEG